MNTAAKSKKFGAVAAALVLSAGLVVASAGAAEAAYPEAPSIPDKPTSQPPRTVKPGKTIKVAGKTVAKAKVFVTYGKTKKTATKKLDTDIADSKGKYSTDFKIKKKGTWYVKVTIKKTGYATDVTYYKVVVK